MVPHFSNIKTLKRNNVINVSGDKDSTRQLYLQLFRGSLRAISFHKTSGAKFSPPRLNRKIEHMFAAL